MSAVSSILMGGGVVVYPSDTVYGLLTDGWSEEACRKLAALKGYDSQRPFIVLAENIETACGLTSTKNSEGIMKRYWPGPVTLVLPASDAVPGWLLGPSGGVAVRIPSDPLSEAIIEATPTGLVSTSANIAGGTVPLELSQVPDSILRSADAVIDGGTLHARRPSRVIDLTGGEAKVLR